MRRSHPIADLPAAAPAARIRAAALAAAVLLCGSLFAAEPIRTYPTLRLKDGRTLSSVAVINYTTGGILVRHVGGATTVRAELLPSAVQADLNIRSIFLAPPAESVAGTESGTDGAADDVSAVDFAAIEALRRRVTSRDWELANRPALPEVAYLPAVAPASVAAEPASPEAPEPLPAMALAAALPADATTPAAPAAPALNAEIAAHVADAEAVPAPAAAPAASIAAAAPAPAGEGNIPEFFTQQKPLQAEAAVHSDVAGRIVVAPPGLGNRFLAGVEVRAYPAATFPGFLAQAKARAQSAAQRLLDQAVAAAAEKRLDDHAALTAKAERIAGRYLDYLPEAPFQARTDVNGHFTLRHDLREVRLVAVGYARADRREWTYEWVGLTPASDLVLSEANATTVNPADPGKARFAAR
jgi:hypothetical protein